MTVSREDPLPHCKHPDRLVELRPLPEPCYEEPALVPCPRTRLSQTADEARRGSPGRHRRDAPGLDVLRTPSEPVRDEIIALPIPRLTCERAMGGMTADTQVADLEDPLWTTLLQAFPATVHLPGVSKTATEGPGKPLAAMRLWKSAGDQRQTTTIIVLIPAHNEERTIVATVTSILAQDLKPDGILVICDNCTDDTEAVARKAGAETYVTVDNYEMKAGALNQALDFILPGLADDDLVMVIDADTLVSANFIREAAAQFRRHPQCGGLSGIYSGGPGGGLVGWCQRNEFARWGFDGRQQFGKALCLSGAASIFTIRGLRKVVAARTAGRIPGGPTIYNTGNFTEDFELSQALLHTGSQVKNLLNVSIETAIKPTWAALHTQRRRWNRGTTETLRAFGWTRHTWQMWVRWLVYTFSTASIPLSLFLISERLASGAGFYLNAWMALWIGVTAVTMMHKAITVIATRGAFAALAAFMLVVELPYDMFLHVTFVRSLWDSMTGRNKTWR